MNKNGKNAACLAQEPLNLVYSREPLLKQAFLEELTREALPVIYLDLDLLYSGYIASGIIDQNPRITVRRIRVDNLQGEIASAAQAASLRRCLVIIDSLNGLYNLPGMERLERTLSSYIMMLASMAEQIGSIVIGSCIGSGSSWSPALFPLSTTPTQVRRMAVIDLRRVETGIEAVLIREGSNIEGILIPFERL